MWKSFSLGWRLAFGGKSTGAIRRQRWPSACSDARRCISLLPFRSGENFGGRHSCAAPAQTLCSLPRPCTLCVKSEENSLPLSLWTSLGESSVSSSIRILYDGSGLLYWCRKIRFVSRAWFPTIFNNIPLHQNNYAWLKFRAIFIFIISLIVLFIYLIITRLNGLTTFTH